MKRFAFKMYLKKGCEKEYAKRHAAIWPELKQMIKNQGVSDYSIFWDKDTNLLFAVQKCDSDTIIGMRVFCIPLEELFHMD